MHTGHTDQTYLSHVVDLHNLQTNSYPRQLQHAHLCKEGRSTRMTELCYAAHRAAPGKEVACARWLSPCQPSILFLRNTRSTAVMASVFGESSQSRDPTVQSTVSTSRPSQRPTSPIVRHTCEAIVLVGTRVESAHFRHRTFHIDIGQVVSTPRAAH